MARKRISTFVLTAHSLETAYGNIRVPEKELQHLLDEFLSGNVIQQAQHDPHFPLHLEIVSAELRRTEDGTLGIWAEMDVDEAEWGWAGGDLLQGFSVSLTQSVVHLGAHDAPSLTFAADAAHFSDEDLEAAARAFAPHFSAYGSRMFQFSVTPPPNVILELSIAVLRDIGIAFVANALYAGLRRLLRPRHGDRSIFTFRFKDAERKIVARIETGDEDVLRDAIDKMTELADSTEEYHEYDPETKEWRGYL